MAVNPNSLLRPTGRLKAAMFPEDNIATLASQLVTAATARVTALAVPAAQIDIAVTALAYWWAFTSLADDLALEGSKQRDGDVTTEWSPEDRARWGLEAAQWADTYLAALGGLIDPLGPGARADPAPILTPWVVT